MASEKSRSEIWDEWKSLVNIPAHELEAWLDTEESRSVGDSSNGELTGHIRGGESSRYCKPVRPI